MSSPRKRRGVALVLVLWVTMVAGLMLVGVMNAARQQRALAHGELSAVEAHWLARAGVEQAMAVLEDDDDPAVDSTLDKWYRDEPVFENVELGAGSFSVRSAADDNRPGMDDESARINLNIADKGQLQQTKWMSDGQIDALIEWRTPVNPALGGGGNPGGYYQQLQFPYDMRGGPFQTHRELQLVRGFEDRKFFGNAGSSLAPSGAAAQTTVYSYQSDHDPAGTPRVNLNSASAQTMQERLNFSPQLAQAVVQGRQPRYENLVALLNVRPQGGGRAGAGAGANAPPSASGQPPVTQITLHWLAEHAEQVCLENDARLPAKINVNTASHDVLKSLPGMNDDLADRIITQRGSSGGVFRTLAELLDRRVLETNVFQQMFERLTVRSDVFSVESVGTSAGGIQRRIYAVIDRGTTPVSIVYWYQTP